MSLKKMLLVIFLSRFWKKGIKVFFGHLIVLENFMLVFYFHFVWKINGHVLRFFGGGVVYVVYCLLFPCFLHSKLHVQHLCVRVFVWWVVLLYMCAIMLISLLPLIKAYTRDARWQLIFVASWFIWKILYSRVVLKGFHGLFGMKC